jgi:translation initiation factor IF-2
MAHTVETLSKLLKRTPDQVISILTAAGIQGKNADSNISADERQILMSSLSKRSSNKLNISVPRKTPKMSTTSSSTGGVKIKVKKKREDPIVSASDVVNDEVVSKAREALEAGRLAEQKDQEHDAKRHEVVRQQKIKTEELKAQDIQNKAAKKDELANKDKEKKVEVEKAKEDKKQPKRLRSTVKPASRQKQLHVAKHNPNRKLKKKERTQISQKVQDEQAQHGFHKPVEPITREVYIPETIKISELALKMTTKAGEVLKVMMSMGVMATLNNF